MVTPGIVLSQPARQIMPSWKGYKEGDTKFKWCSNHLNHTDFQMKFSSSYTKLSWLWQDCNSHWEVQQIKFGPQHAMKDGIIIISRKAITDKNVTYIQIWKPPDNKCTVKLTSVFINISSVHLQLHVILTPVYPAWVISIQSVIQSLDIREYFIPLVP